MSISRNQKFLLIVILLFAVIIGWKPILIMAFGGPGYFAVSPQDRILDSLVMRDEIHSLSGQDFESHPAWEEMIVHQKKVLRASDSLLDLIPGNLWGPEYANLRISPEEDYFLRVNGPGILYAYNGSYYRVEVTQ